ncbi:MAG: UDP-N-acetylmuramoyl-L-alanyl-D-glutamate--2,6-diaminopimelate ligase [Planctomycetes bacterium]|nr:UDP-N-acetylmuramoyl-L-alanyl-D-glutamate--2,6-diaminopimelate ligase [Planctomycetota bacterium]
MELSELKPILLGLKGTKLYNFRNLDITGVSYNSKQVKPGDLFVAIPGAKTDGAYFIPEALQRGAVAVISNQKLNLFTMVPYIRVSDPRAALALASNHFFHYPSRKLKVIGITGTNGKTTTAYLIKSILDKIHPHTKDFGVGAGLIGTIEYLIGERHIPAPVTTPQSYDLQNYFAQMLKDGTKYSVMEVSSHSLVQKRVLGIDFHRAIFTNLTRDHLDFHKTPNQYKQAKAILFKNLSAESIAILNADDPVSKYYAKITPAQVVWYHCGNLGTQYKNCVPRFRGILIQAQILSSSLYGNTILLKTPIGETTVQSPLIGRHNVYNILAAAATAVSLGVPVDTIREGVEQFRMMRGRLETIPNNAGFTVMVDFGHTEDALKNVLGSLKPLVKGRIITVFGCGGDRDRGKRPLMGKVVSKLSDLFVITSDNPRSEDPLKIIKDIRKGIRSPHLSSPPSPFPLPSGERVGVRGKERVRGYYVEPDRYEAIKKALSLARQGDLVLIAGKGHETYQIFRDTVKPFDDREVVKQLLQ